MEEEYDDEIYQDVGEGVVGDGRKTNAPPLGNGAGEADTLSVCRTSQRFDADSDEDQTLQPHPKFWLFLHIDGGQEVVDVYFHHRYYILRLSFFLC